MKVFESDEEIHEDFLILEMETNSQKQEANAALKLNLGKQEADAALKAEMDANLRKQESWRLAMESFARGNNLFFYRLGLKPDLDVEISLNRSVSTPNNKPGILIMGGFYTGDGNHLQYGRARPFTAAIGGLPDSYS